MLSCWTAQTLMVFLSAGLNPILPASRSSETITWGTPCDTLDPAQAQVRPQWLVRRRQDTMLHESHHPSDIAMVRKHWQQSTGGRKEEGPAGAGPASGSSGSSGQGLQQAPRHERQWSSTAGPSTQLSSLSELTWLTAGRVGFWKTPPQGDQSRVVGISSAGCLVQGWKSKWEAGAHYLSCCIPRLSSIIKKLAVGTYLHLQMLTDPGGGRLPCQKWEGSWVPHDGFVLLTSGVFFSFKKYSSKNGCLKMPQPIQLITRFYRRQ